MKGELGKVRAVKIKENALCCKRDRVALNGACVVALEDSCLPVIPQQKGIGMRSHKLMIVVVGVVLLSLLMGCEASIQTEEVQHTPQGVAFVWRKRPDGSRYMGIPAYKASDSSKIQPAIHVRKILSAPKVDVKDELKRQLGKEISFTFNKRMNTYVAKPPRPFKGIKEVWIDFYRGKVLGVTIRFEPPAKEWAMAIALVDLEPRNTPPTEDGLGGAIWKHAFSGIDEVAGLHKPLGNIAIEAMGITPSEAMEKEAEDVAMKKALN